MPSRFVRQNLFNFRTRRVQTIYSLSCLFVWLFTLLCNATARPRLVRVVRAPCGFQIPFVAVSIGRWIRNRKKSANIVFYPFWMCPVRVHINTRTPTTLHTYLALSHRTHVGSCIWGEWCRPSSPPIVRFVRYFIKFNTLRVAALVLCTICHKSCHDLCIFHSEKKNYLEIDFQPGTMSSHLHRVRFSAKICTQNGCVRRTVPYGHSKSFIYSILTSTST